LEKAFDDTGYRPTLRLRVAKELGETSLMFLVHPSLTDQDVDRTCQVIREVLSMAERNTMQAVPELS
jgi:dTDP-4-amino-4,6-dideoxygalactose transaminase